METVHTAATAKNRRKEGFVVRIPDNLSMDAASPLLCAGITTFSPLKHWNAGPGKKWRSWEWAALDM